MNPADPVDVNLRAILADILGLSRARTDALTNGTPLFGSLPEFDSMAAAGVIAEVEERFDLRVDDDDLGPEDLETFGSLLAFVHRLQKR